MHWAKCKIAASSGGNHGVMRTNVTCLAGHIIPLGDDMDTVLGRLLLGHNSRQAALRLDLPSSVIALLRLRIGLLIMAQFKAQNSAHVRITVLRPPQSFGLWLCPC
jgi:hypothetical protein